jgi:hypothetical protein
MSRSIASAIFFTGATLGADQRHHGGIEGRRRRGRDGNDRHHSENGDKDRPRGHSAADGLRLTLLKNAR